MLTINAIKIPTGYYIFASYASWENYILNNGSLVPTSTFSREWSFIPEAIQSVQRSAQQPPVNHRYMLRDASLACDKIPLMLPRDEVAQQIDGGWYFKPEHAHLASLYELQYDTLPDVLEDVPFSFNVQYEADHEAFEAPTFVYPVKNQKITIESREITHRLIDEICTPAMYLHEKPCKIPSQKVYEIIRAYVKENINPAVAVVTSDYDFCFTVKKRIKLATPIKYTVDINNSPFDKRKKKPIYVGKVKEFREAEIFEMTSKERHYNGYTILPDLEGSSEADAKQKLDAYLEDLISFINEPITECPHCNGEGMIYSKDFKGKLI